MGAHDLTGEIAALLASGEHRTAEITLEPCAAGGNNRVFLVHAGERRLIAKWYFSHPSDTRDRLRAEYSLLQYAEKLGLGCVPRPVSCDPAAHLALYEYIDGRKLSTDEVGEHEVNSALAFFLALNDPAHRDLTTDLPPASEARFSLTDHFDMVERRIGQLAGIAPETDIDREAQAFVTGMSDRWEALKAGVKRGARDLGLEPDASLADSDRCISPSDFGFHNALSTRERGLVFIDFEYAGWDDPAKLANDFFCQPAVPVNACLYEDFVERAMRFSANAALLVDRAHLMRPIFQLKWCCIVLNNFLPVAAQRRRFADPSFNGAERKVAQLALARHRFSAI
ncbi:MAG: aminoglycoside phosphotransferase family protein [Betaproteobacteria bacterium]